MKYNHFGKVIGKKQGTDFYIIESASGEYHIIESTDELEIEDIISWDDSATLFYNESYSFTISAILQWEYLTYHKAVNILSSL